jgi:hypothetical protein
MLPQIWVSWLKFYLMQVCKPWHYALVEAVQPFSFSQAGAFGISLATGDQALLLTKTIKFYTSNMGISKLNSEYPPS